jgi:glutamate/tyrosine decarboxylase-like PLP-dependent enzyme
VCAIFFQRQRLHDEFPDAEIFGLFFIDVFAVAGTQDYGDVLADSYNGLSQLASRHSLVLIIVKIDSAEGGFIISFTAIEAFAGYP